MKINIVEIPIDFKKRFEANVSEAMRNLGGWSDIELTTLFDDTKSIFACLNSNLKNPFNERTIRLDDSFQPIYNTNYYMHLDGSEGGDGYGICMCHLEGWTNTEPLLPIIKIDFLGAANKKTYGEGFSKEIFLESFDELMKELVKRKFNIDICTFDRATDVRMIKGILEPEGTNVIPMSIDRCSKFPVKDYSKAEPPYIRMESTNSNYALPMLDFKNICNREGLIVPYIEDWYKIPFAFEYDQAKKIVTKIQGSLDDLGQAVAGAVFNCLNNEKDQSLGRTIEKQTKGKWIVQEKPDSFNELLDVISNTSKAPVQNDKNFDRVPDEIELNEDDFYDNFGSIYYI